MPLPKFLIGGSLQDVTRTTNNLISHVDNTAAYLLVSPTSTPRISQGNISLRGNATIRGAISANTILITGPLTANGANGTSGQVLTSNGNGLYWSTISVPDGDKGDITVSATGATWTIDNAVVTYAKIQNISAANKILGRSTAGAGSIEELNIGSGLSLSGGTLSATGGGGETSNTTGGSGAIQYYNGATFGASTNLIFLGTSIFIGNSTSNSTYGQQSLSLTDMTNSATLNTSTLVLTTGSITSSNATFTNTLTMNTALVEGSLDLNNFSGGRLVLPVGTDKWSG